MDIVWVLSALAVAIAALSLVLSLYWRVKNTIRNDLRHIHGRIDAVEEDISDLRERSSAVERDVVWLKKQN